MKAKKLFAIIGILFLVSCGGSNKQTKTEDKNVELTPYENQVKGYLSNVFEVVNGTYKLECKHNIFLEGKIQIKIKSIGKGNTNDYGFRDGNHGPLYVTICNKEGQPITSLSNIPSSFEADGLLKDMVSEEGKENWILFESFLDETIPEDASTFFITSKKIEEEKDTRVSKNNDNGTNDVFSNENNPKWDKVLDDYEAYVDKYLEVIKKSNNDDSLGALLDYPELLEKTKDLEESLEEAKTSNSLSAKQVRRMAEIQIKMINAVSEMEDDFEL